MPRLMLFVIPIALWIYGVINCAQTPDHKMPKGLSKPVWLTIIMLVPAIGTLIWLGVKNYAAQTGGTMPGRPRRPKGPIAPDDDPEFLANLDWQARKAHHERLKREKEAREAEEKRKKSGRRGDKGAGSSGGAAGGSEDSDRPDPLSDEFPDGFPDELPDEFPDDLPDDPSGVR